MKLKDIVPESITIEELYESVKRRKEETDKRRGYSQKDTAIFLKKNYPNRAQKIIEDADRYLEGMILLPGTGAKPYFVGNPPDWFNNPVNHNEYTFHLNRMNYWRELLQAYEMTGEGKYAQKVIDELLDWIEKAPRPDITKDMGEARKRFSSVDPWRSLECGIRTYKTWPYVIEHLIGTEFLTHEVLEKYIISAYEQAEVVKEICPMFFPKADHNHYIMENLGLLTVAGQFPELAESEEWLEHAVRELERCAVAQITEDGGQIEGCPSYHNGAVFWFAVSLILANNYNIEFPESYVERIRKMLDYSFYSFRPTGFGVPWGDSNTNRGAIRSSVFGYIVFGDMSWLEFAKNLCDSEIIKQVCIKEIWQLGSAGIEEVFKYLDDDTAKPSYELPTMSWQHELKQVAMRTDWSDQALSAFFACRTPIENNHAHIDPMGFDFTAYGKALVVDPGKYTYKEGEERKNFKSAEWHNTLLVDDKPHFEYISSWRFGPQKHGDITSVKEEEGIMYTTAEHYNYEPTVHRRLLAIVDEKYLLVLDRVEDIKEDSTAQIYYHMDSANVKLDLAKGCVNTEDDDVNVAIFYDSQKENLKAELLPAKISDANDIWRDSLRMCIRDSGGADSISRDYITIIAPYSADSSMPTLDELKSERIDDSITHSFKLNGKTYSFKWDGDEKLEWERGN